MLDVFPKLENEYRNVYDPCNKDIVLYYLNTLLSYSHSFYNRQFANRRQLNEQIAERCLTALTVCQTDGKGIPTVAAIALTLNLSPKYLSELLKATTGKTASEHIHLSLLDRAKLILQHWNKTVSEIAYGLGFEYQQYFNRLFKSKTGVSPAAFRKLLRN